MKLSDIQYGQARSLPKGPGAQAAVGPALQRMQLAQDTIKLLGEVAEEHREYELTKSTSGYADEMEEFRKQTAGMNYSSPEELKAAGLDDLVNVEGREHIPKSEWYPAALQRKMDQARDRWGQGIRSEGDRRQWIDKVTSANNEMLIRETEKAARETAAHIEGLKVSDVERSIRRGQFDTAMEAADSIRDPVKRERYKEDVLIAKEMNENANFRASATPEQLREQAVNMRSEEYNEGSNLSREQNEQQARQLETLANVRESEVKKREAEVYNARVDGHWQQYWNDPAALLANMPEDLKQEDIRAIIGFSSKTAGGGTIKTDVAEWYKLDQMSTNPERFDEFADVNLLQYRDKLSTADFQKLSTRQQELRAKQRGEVDVPNYMTNEQLYNEGFAALGFAGSMKREERYALTGVFANELEAQERWRAANGKPPMTTAEKRQLINDIAVGEVTRKDKVVQVRPFKDLDENEIATLAANVAGTGIAVTAESADAASALMDKGIEVTRDNLIAAYNLRADGKIVNQKTVEQWKVRARELGHQ